MDETTYYGDYVAQEENFKDHFISRVTTNPGQYVYLKYYFCRVANCTIVTEKYNRSNLPDIFYGSYILFGQNRTDTVGLAYNWFDLICAIPHLDNSQTNSTYEMSNLLLFFIAMFVLVLIVTLFLKLAKLGGTGDWGFLQVLLCILGSSISTITSPRERILYLWLILTSVYVGNDFIEIATENELHLSFHHVETFKQVQELKLPIYSTHTDKVFFEAEEKYATNDLIRSQSFSCLKKLLKNNDRICATSAEDFYIASSYIADGPTGKGLRKANFVLMRLPYVQKFKPRSFFVDIFNKILSHCIETKLIARPTHKEFVNMYKAEFNNGEYDALSDPSLNLSIGLILVMAVFHSISIAVFIFKIVKFKILRYIMIQRVIRIRRARRKTPVI